MEFEVKIISKPNIEDWSFSTDCYQCKAKLQADHNDLKHKIETKYSSSDGWGDGGSYEVDAYYVECPLCNAHIDVKSNGIPYLLTVKVKKGAKK